MMRAFNSLLPHMKNIMVKRTQQRAPIPGTWEAILWTRSEYWRIPNTLWRLLPRTDSHQRSDQKGLNAPLLKTLLSAWKYWVAMWGRVCISDSRTWTWSSTIPTTKINSGAFFALSYFVETSFQLFRSPWQSNISISTLTSNWMLKGIFSDQLLQTSS
jgi:hypothetical protein